MTLRLNGSTSGYSEINAPAIAGDQTFTLPGSGGIIQTVGTSLTLGTAQASTSGTSIDFTGIPSYAKRVTVMFNGVSTSGTSQPYLQLGDAGGIEITGYTTSVGSISTAANTTNGSSSVTAAFPLYTGAVTASEVIHGNVQIIQLSGNTWTVSGVLLSGARTVMIAGSKALSDVLTQLRITTANGTDTFDAGTINILYEG